MTTLILILIVLSVVRMIARRWGAKVRGAGHITTETVVSVAAEPQDWAPYAMPTFLRREGAEATRLRHDLAEFRKELDTVQDGDWIDRLIRRQIAAQGPA